MYKHILLPVDGSDLSLKAVDAGLAFAKSVAAKITFIHVVAHRRLVLEEGISLDLVQKLEREYEQAAKASADEMLAGLQERAKTEGIKSEGVVIVSDIPYREIIDHAAKSQADLIMMASHGRRGLEGLLLGSETVKVLTHCNVPVLVVR